MSPSPTETSDRAPHRHDASFQGHRVLPAASIIRLLPRRVERADAAVRRLPGGRGASRRSPSPSVFGIYALAVLVALLVVGSLSDHVGRRPVLIAAIAVAGGRDDDLRDRRRRRGAAGRRASCRACRPARPSARSGAGMLDIDRAKGTVANAVGADAGHRHRRPARRGCWCSTCRRRRTWSTSLLGVVFVAPGDRRRADARVGARRGRARWRRCARTFGCPRAARAAVLRGRARAGRQLVAGRLLRLARPDAGAPHLGLARRSRSAGSRCSSSPGAGRWPCCCPRAHTTRAHAGRDGGAHRRRRADPRRDPPHFDRLALRRHRRRGHRIRRRLPGRDPHRRSAGRRRTSAPACCRSST